MKKAISILFVSNCFGEDRAASCIAYELKRLANQKKVEIFGASLISDARYYIDKGIDVIYSSEIPPSGGFPTKSIKGFFVDLFAGSLKNIFNYRKKISVLKGKIDILFVVGDVFLLFITKGILKPRKTVFLALAKSDYFMPHYVIEKFYLRKNADYVLTRDEFTANNLRKSNINALFLGNPLVDGLEPKGYNFPVKENERIIGLLPGSRKEAYKNFEIILDIIENLKDENLIFITALSDNIKYEDFETILKNKGYKIEYIDFPMAKKGNLKILLTKGIFQDVLYSSEIILGLAGTANEQAAAAGKPVITFVGSGVQSNYKRMKEQEKLLGGAAKFIDNRKNVAKEIISLLNNREERLKMGKIGKERMGQSGGSKNIANFLLKEVINGIQ